MGQEITGLYPKLVWENFYQLTQIPRPSKHEEKAIKYVQSVAEKKGLQFKVDEIGNIIVKKPATAGFENRETVVLQSHVDMVPQKNTDVIHDFEKDPIQTQIEDGWVTAIDTTLGADNGMGAAAMLAVLEDDTLKHGPIEALFTVDEEAGMGGAFGLKPGYLEGTILLNLDSEDEGELYVGCAGGVNVNATFDMFMEEVPEGYSAYELQLTGLKGGHSGLDINIGRANANKQMARILKGLIIEDQIILVDFNGGTLRNAIPREAFAKILVPTDLSEQFSNDIQTINETLNKEFQYTEPNLKLECLEIPMPEVCLNEMVQDDLINALMGCFDGAFRMDPGMPGVVESSNNISIVKTKDDRIQVMCLVRSSVDTVKEWIVAELKSVFSLAGARVTTSGTYPGWKPNPNSKILDIMQKVYKENWNKTPQIKAIHAGLECGIIGATYPQLDMISFGPTIKFPHSPDEKVHIESVGKFWEWLVLTLEEISQV